MPTKNEQDPTVEEPTQENEQDGNPTGAEGETPNAEKGEKTFTQAEVDAIVEKRLAREKARADAEAQKAKDEAEAKTLEEQKRFQELADKRGKLVEELTAERDLEMTAASFSEAVIDTLVAYGVNEIGKARNIAKLRALARVEAWKAVLSRCSGRVTFSANGASFNLSDLAKQARENLTVAEGEAMAYGLVGYAVGVGHLRVNDPYRVDETDEHER